MRGFLPVAFVAVAILSTTLGWIAGRHAGGLSGSAEAAPQVPNTLQCAAQAPAVCLASLTPEATAVLRGEIRQVLVQQLSAMNIKPAPSTEPTERSLETQQVTSSQEAAAAHDDVIQLIDRAVGAQSWTTADIESFRQLRHRMTPEQIKDVTQRLVGELNSGRLKAPEGARPF